MVDQIRPAIVCHALTRFPAASVKSSSSNPNAHRLGVA
jgi:hypothetical protein